MAASVDLSLYSLQYAQINLRHIWQLSAYEYLLIC